MGITKIYQFQGTHGPKKKYEEKFKIFEINEKKEYNLSKYIGCNNSANEIRISEK